MVVTGRRRQLVAKGALLILAGVVMAVGPHKLRRKRRYKTRPIYRQRKQKGFFNATFLPMKAQDPEQFFRYTRMSVATFMALLDLVEPFVRKRTITDSICAEERLEITLQYLAQGVSMQSLAWSHQMGLTTVHRIINSMCRVLWDVLHEKYLPVPTRQEWLCIAQEFESQWNFPHCIGALDGKHIAIQAPAHSGSLFSPTLFYYNSPPSSRTQDLARQDAGQQDP